MKKAIFICCLIMLIVFNSCKKEGLNGDITLTVFPQHHGNAIKGTTLYIKFDAIELPSNPTINYDAKFVGKPSEVYIQCEKLKWGDYYLYFEGYDSSVMETVKGGIAVKIKYSERKKEIDITVPVTE